MPYMDIITPNPQRSRWAKLRVGRWMRRTYRRCLKFCQSQGRVALIGLVIFVGLLLVLTYLNSRDTSGFPVQVKDDANFLIFYPPKDNPRITVDKASIKYDKTNHGVSYNVHVNKVLVVVTQQSEPDIFRENGVYSYKLSQARQYQTLQTGMGEVALTRPPSVGNQPVAWARAKGTLLLAHAERDLSDKQWKYVFDNLRVLKDQ